MPKQRRQTTHLAKRLVIVATNSTAMLACTRTLKTISKAVTKINTFGSVGTIKSQHDEIIQANARTMVLGSSSQLSVAAGRLPILLQVTDATLAAGPLGQPLPLHTQALLEPCPSTKDGGEALYSFLADPLTSLFHRLLGTKIAQSGVIVLHSYGVYPNEAWKLAISRLLNDLLKVPKVCFLSTLHSLPALISHSHSVLAVHISEREFQCMVTAVDHDPLEYTFQSVPLSLVNGQAAREELDGALVRALCLSILACPRSHRMAAIQNIVVDDISQGDVARVTTIVRKLYEFLTSPSSPRHDTTTSTDLPRSDDDNDVLVPIRRDEIKALAPFIGIVEFKVTFRLAYLGASVLASSLRRDLPWQDINGI